MSSRDVLVITLIAVLSIGLIGTVAAETIEQEPNDDFDTAQEISEGETAGEITDGESDFYKLEVNTTDALDVEATADSGLINLRIFDSDRNEIGAALGGSSERRVTVKAPETGTFFIEVSGSNQQTTTNYTLAVEKITPAENDAFAPNDGFISAASLDEGSINAKIWGGESDFYKIEANTTDALDVDATAGNGSIDLRIFDPNQDEIIGDVFGGSSKRSATIKAPETGTFFIQITGDNQQTTTNYTLNVDRVTPAENDAFAPNDDFKSATVIIDQFTNAQIWGGESDFYRVGLDAREGLKVEVRADSGDVNLRVFDPDLNVVAEDVFGRSSERNVTIRASEAGTYFLEIASQDQQTTTKYQFQSNQTGLLPEPASPVAEYADPETGVVGPDGLLAAAADFRAGEIEASLLLDVAAAFRSGEPVR